MMITESSGATPFRRAGQASTEEIVALIDWALGDVTVDQSVDEAYTRAARRARAAESEEIRREAA